MNYPLNRLSDRHFWTLQLTHSSYACIFLFHRWRKSAFNRFLKESTKIVPCFWEKIYCLILYIEIWILNWLNLYFINLIQWPFQSIWQLHPILIIPNDSEWQRTISNDFKDHVTNQIRTVSDSRHIWKSGTSTHLRKK